MAFVALIIGAVLINSISSTTIGVTETISIVDEADSLANAIDKNSQAIGINTSYNYTVTNAPTGWKGGGECSLTSIVMTNNSGTAYTANTDYIIDANSGIFHFLNTSQTYADAGSNNITKIDYRYCGDDYLNSSWGRTGANLVSGFFAMALLLISVGLFFSVAKDCGLIGGFS